MPFVPDNPNSGFKPDEQSALDTAKKYALLGFNATPLGVLWRGMQGFDAATKEAGGLVTDVASKVMPPEAAAGLGVATHVGLQSVPMLFGGTAAKSAAPVLRSGAESVMQSALKPPFESLRRGDATKAISTMLDEGISVTEGGVHKLRDKIADLNREVMKKIVTSQGTVNKAEAAKELFGTIKRFEKQVNPNADIKAIESAWSEFLSHPLIAGKEMPVQLAQELKQGTYRALEGKYGELGSATTEAQKALARGLKEGIEKVAPEVKQLNAKEAELLRALELVERRVLMEGNKNLGGLAWLSTHPEVWAAFMADKSAPFKSAVARMLNAGKEQIPVTATRVGIGGYQATKNRPE